MDTVRSTDQTPIAYRTSGDGPPLVLVHGTPADHHRWRPVLPLLEKHRTVYAVDRRGRGGSGDPAPPHSNRLTAGSAPLHPLAADAEHTLDREFEDVAAVVRAVAELTGGPVDLLGHSYGGLCALGGARLAGDALRRLVVYEPPIGPAAVLFAPDLLARLEALLAQDRRDEALQVFFRDEVRMPPHELAVLRGLPAWQARLAAAHTIPRELRAVVGFDPAPEWFKWIAAPTLLLLGGDSSASVAQATEYVRRQLAEVAGIAEVRVEVMPGQQHVAIDTAPELFARLVIGFLAGHASDVDGTAS